MLHKHRLMLTALAAVAMAAAGESGSDTSGTGAGAPPAGDPPAPSPSPAPAKAVKLTAVRVLADCVHGKANDVAQLGSDELKNALAQGFVDDDKDAVAYAKSLPQNQPKPAKAS